jgi:hypothetical protein
MFHRTVLSVWLWRPCFDNFDKLLRANTVFVSFSLSLLLFWCILAMCLFKFDLLANIRPQTIHSFSAGIFAGIVMTEWSWDPIHFIARLQFFLYGDAPLLSSNIEWYVNELYLQLHYTVFIGHSSDNDVKATFQFKEWNMRTILASWVYICSS